VLRGISAQYDVELAGIKLRCYCDNATDYRAIIGHGQKARSGSDLIEMITRELRPGDVFVDVGANCGQFTLFAARQVGADGRAIAIEPIPAMVSRLTFDLAANNFTNVSVFETAVGADVGTTTLYVHENEYGQSRLFPVDGYVPIPVSVTTLLNIVREAGVERIDAMKVDIEGYEDRAIIPYIEAAPRKLWPRKLLMEIRNRRLWQSDCTAALGAAGYRVLWSDRNDALYAI
jgi:FkbM family methyltransferase